MPEPEVKDDKDHPSASFKSRCDRTVRAIEFVVKRYKSKNRDNECS